MYNVVNVQNGLWQVKGCKTKEQAKSWIKDFQNVDKKLNLKTNYKIVKDM